jgi:hypothetical protein
MKWFLILSCITFNITINAQSTPAVNKNSLPAYFIDSVRFKERPVFDPNNIDNIFISKEYDKVSGVHGKIYIKTKSPKNLHFITLKQVGKNNGIRSKSLVFMIDNEFIKDENSVIIDSSYVLKCVAVKSTDFNSLKNEATFTILKIVTRSKENLDKENTIHLRGNTTASIHD